MLFFIIGILTILHFLLAYINFDKKSLLILGFFSLYIIDWLFFFFTWVLLRFLSSSLILVFWFCYVLVLFSLCLLWLGLASYICGFRVLTKFWKFSIFPTPKLPLWASFHSWSNDVCQNTIIISLWFYLCLIFFFNLCALFLLLCF